MTTVSLYGSGTALTRIREPLLLAIFSGLIVLIALLVVLLVQLAAPSTESGACPVGTPCAPPAGAPSGLPGSWVSELGFQVEYLPSAWAVRAKEPRRLRLEYANGEWISIRGVRGRNPRQLYDDELRRIRRAPGVRSLVATNPGERRILGPRLGSRAALGGIFCAHVGAQGVNTYVELFVLAAADRRASAVVSVYTNDCEKSLRASDVLLAADSVLNTFMWPEEAR
jgi:hypothetical protein